MGRGYYAACTRKESKGEEDVEVIFIGILIGLGLAAVLLGLWICLDSQRKIEQLPRMKFPEYKPEFDLLFNKTVEAIGVYVLEKDIYDLINHRLYLGNKEYEIYKDWFDNYVCFYGRKDYEQDLIAGIKIQRVNRDSEFYIGENV